jgi:pimeloyl-ACP methyl ester carboxylesterase/DNA-binding winged helix-turn-helix (wHTH) protein
MWDVPLGTWGVPSRKVTALVYQFGPFQLDVTERRLLEDGEPVSLRSKVFDTLALLVQNHGRLLRKDEIMQKIWPDAVVEENNLDHNISRLRRLLGEGRNGHKYIETVPRQGYRFVSEVKPISQPALHKVQPLPDYGESPSLEVKFFTTSDGVRIAYTLSGDGPPLVRAIDWLNHLDFEWKNPFQRQWLTRIMRHHTVLRYDQRGTGLSDWNIKDFTFERTVQDLEELIEACGIDHFVLQGGCQGGTAAMAYAARHPERVTRLILVGAFARGWPTPENMANEQFQALLTLTRLGWGRDNPAFRQLWTTLFMPDATPAEMDWMNELQRVTTSPENASRMMSEFPKANILDQLPRIECPSLVMHSRDDAVVSVQESRLIASRIRGSRFVELPSRNHQISPGDPAWSQYVDEFGKFLGWSSEHNSTIRQAAG